MSIMETIAFISYQDILNRLVNVANLAMLSPAERELYDYVFKKTHDHQAELKLATKTGLEQSRVEGWKDGWIKGWMVGFHEGQVKEKYLTAKRLLDMGMDIGVIAQATGLNEEEILKISND